MKQAEAEPEAKERRRNEDWETQNIEATKTATKKKWC